MRRQVLLVVLACGLASCGGNGSSAESEATNATLLDDATVNALLGSDIPEESLRTAADESGNEFGENEADATANDTN